MFYRKYFAGSSGFFLLLFLFSFGMSRIRGIVFVILAIVSGVFAIAGVSTNFVTVETGSVKQTTTLWRTCIKVTSSSGQSAEECRALDSVVFDCYKPKFRGARAAAILAIATALVLCPIVGALDALGRLPYGRIGRLTLAASAFLLCVFLIVVWALQANLYNAGCDGSQSPREADGEYGPSLPLFVAAWVLSLVMIVISFVLPNPPRRVDKMDGPVVGLPVVHPVGVAHHSSGTAAAVPPYPAAAGAVPPYNSPYPSAHEEVREDGAGQRVEIVDHAKKDPLKTAA